MRIQNIAIIFVYGFLLIASGAFLFGCGEDSASTAPATGKSPVAGSLGQSAVGAWMADTILQYDTKNPIIGVISPKIVVADTLRADSSFSAAVYVRDIKGNIVNGNSVIGSLHTRSGRWTVVGDSLLILNTSTCEQSDTATVMGTTLPFSFPGLVANTKKPILCGAPDTVRTRPQTDGHWLVPMNVDLQGFATGQWVLDFVRQP